MTRKRSAPRPDEFPQALPPRSPERQSVQGIPPATSFSGYPTAARSDYGYYQQPPVKRHRTSIDYGRQSIYDDNRMARQMDAYGQPQPIYPSQPGSYQTPTMGGYSGSQVMPDYGMVCLIAAWAFCLYFRETVANQLLGLWDAAISTTVPDGRPLRTSSQ